MSILIKLREFLDALVHPTLRADVMAVARHRAFVAPRLLGSLVGLAFLPLFLAFRGAPSAIEAAVIAWLVAPIAITWLLSRTGHYAQAHILSALSLAGMVVAVAAFSGGINSFAAVWLALVPIEAALSGSRRVLAFAIALALACAAALGLLGYFGLLPPSQIPAARDGVFQVFGLATATLFAAALALSTEWLSRTSEGLLAVGEERYRLLAHNMGDAVTIHGRNGAVRFISPAGEALFGVALGQLGGHGLFDRVHVADRPVYLTALSRAARDGSASAIEVRVRRDDANGRADFIWIEMRCRPLMAAGEGSQSGEAICVIRDITDRKHQEEALQAARREAERADEAKSRFLATMSHELRTPLNAIIGFSEMISREEELALDPAKRREYAGLIHQSGRHLLEVVNGILDLSKMEAGSYEIEAAPFQPRDAIVSCCNLMSLKARECGLDLRVRVADALPEITGDSRAFRQILINLVSNAIKFTERGGSVTVSARSEAADCVLSVADTGIGIPDSDLARVGDPFFQVEKTYQRRHEGTGLGLSIVKSLVQLHGGEIRISSKLNEGTTVTVRLPLVAHQPSLRSNVMPLTASMRQETQMPVRKSA